MKHFGNELYRIIKEKGLVKKEIAEKISMSPAQFSQLMNKKSFNARTLEKICRVIGVSPGYFFDDWTSEKYTIGDISNATVIGDATVNVGSDVGRLLAEKDKIIAEKERLIRVLLAQTGLDDKIECL